MIPAADHEKKEAALRAWVEQRGSVLVAFSGGVDSAYLSVIARDVLGADHMIAVLGVSASLATEIRERAQRLATEFAVPFLETETHELSDPDYIANRGDRCFHCKKELWQQLAPIAVASGFSCVVDGTIVDDLAEHRPGRAAGAKAGVESPLALCGFSKSDVRAGALARGIPLWNAPAAPCLASRLAVGVRVTPERLARVESAENALRALGIEGDLRVRDIGNAARVELPAGALRQWNDDDRKVALATAVQHAGFERVLLDAHGYRRGALQERGITEVTDITVTSATGSRDTSI